MDTPRNFRSAFNGFNREDVVRYIEYMNAQHVAQVNELNIELEFLRGKLAAAVELDPAVQKRLDDYKEQVTILENRFANIFSGCSHRTQRSSPYIFGFMENIVVVSAYNKIKSLNLFGKFHIITTGDTSV